MNKNIEESLLKSSRRGARVLIWLSFIFVVSLLTWMYQAKIDQLIRGVGRVIPSQKIQTIQNLEGGIVSKILVHEGDKVREKMVLMELDKTSFESKKEENQLKIKELKARILRLNAEAKGKRFKARTSQLKQELELYKANQKMLKQEVSILKKRLFQKRNELKELRAKKENLQHSLSLTRQEVQMKRDLLAQLVGSRNELNLAEQKLSSVEGAFSATTLAIPRLISVIEEVKSKIKSVKIVFQKKAVESLNEAKDELARVKQSNISKKDRVTRATVRSPVAGVVQRVFHNTIGGVVKAGEPIMEIVPSNDILIVSTKIRPSDIASIYLNQEAVVRFTAYDFAIYGSLKGKIINISADTIVDEIDKRSYYQVDIKTNKNYLGLKEQQHKIMTGMVATVDIVGEKKRVLDWVLKPILRAKQNVFSQR